MAKELYFTQLSFDLDPDIPGFREARWITSEDVNVEHLLDIFTSVDGDSERVCDACSHFMYHLYLHKPRIVILVPKVEALPDNHPSEAQCLWDLSRLFKAIGNQVEHKWIPTHTLNPWRAQQ